MGQTLTVIGLALVMCPSPEPITVAGTIQGSDWPDWVTFSALDHRSYQWLSKGKWKRCVKKMRGVGRGGHRC